MADIHATIGYTRNYRARHHPVTALLTNEEFNDFATIAIRQGMKPSAFLTKLARLYVEQSRKLPKAANL